MFWGPCAPGTRYDTPGSLGSALCGAGSVEAKRKQVYAQSEIPILFLPRSAPAGIFLSAYAGKRASESERAHEYVRECLHKRIRVYMFKYICMVGRRALPVQYNVAATHLARQSRDNRGTTIEGQASVSKQSKSKQSQKKYPPRPSVGRAYATQKIA